MSTTRFAASLSLIMFLTLWYALTPSRETTVKLADSRFQKVEEGISLHKYTLALALEEGKSYRIEEVSKHTVTTRNSRSFAKNSKREAFEVLAQTEFLTQVVLDLHVDRIVSDEIYCKAIMVDFVGYEEIRDEIPRGKFQHVEDDDDNDDDDNVERDRKNRNKEMFAKVREETKGIQFEVTLATDGTVKTLETSKLRKAIISALHEVGQLPMHLEHALLVGGYDVFPANGASFGPQGRTRVKAPVYRSKGTGCQSDTQVNFRGKILVVNRGECTFENKADIAAKNDAAALIVVDQDTSEGAVMTYMAGEGDVPIVSVIVNKEAGEAIEREMKLMPDYKLLPNGDMTASGAYLVEILGGVEAVEALNTEEFEDDEATDIKTKSQSHHLNPIHSDGLHDFVGIGYVVDEVIRTRFSIFPQQPVTIGSSWKRTLFMSDGIDPTLKAKVSEMYKLVSITRVEVEQPLHSLVRKGDLIAEISLKAVEIPSFVREKSSSIMEEVAMEEEKKLFNPQFSRPSFKGHTFVTDANYKVHLSTGMIIEGSSTSSSSSEKLVVVINKMNGKRKTIKAKIDLVAKTDYSGSIQ